MTDNKILAASIAAALLVGGGAVAAFNEMRAAGHANDAKAAAVAPQAEISQTGFASADGRVLGDMPVQSAALAPAMTTAFSTNAETRAPIVAVDPVKQSGSVSARVLDIEPVTKSVAQNTPRQVCRDVVVQERLPERDGNVGGTVLGAVIGGLAGNQVGGGRGRDAATVAGAAAGGYIGNRVDKRHVGGRVVNRTEQRCETVTDRSTSEKTIAYNVTYRTPDGSTGIKRMASKPGNTIKVNDSVATAYDVTYSYQGRERTVRLDERPDSKYFPVVEGRVITSI